MFRDLPHNGSRAPSLPNAKSLPDEHELTNQAKGDEMAIERTSSGGLLKEKNTSQRISSWIQKKCLGKISQPAPAESRANAAALAAVHEQTVEQDGCKRTLTYTMAPFKPIEYKCAPKFTTITPQQAAALYSRNHITSKKNGGNSSNSAATDELQARKMLTVKQAMNQQGKTERGCAPTKESTRNVATIGMSPSFENENSTYARWYRKHEEYAPLIPMSPTCVRTLPQIC